MKNAILAGFAAVLLISGCDSSTRPGGPGTLTATVTSPNGDEGAAVLDVVGTVEAFTGSGDVSVYTTPLTVGTRVVLVRMSPGPLSMKLTVPDVSQPPTVSIVEVAAGDDRLRSSVSGYAVTFR
ncbi:MAG TPA: hypothetical protein VM939_09810 [Gemmatimonadaceae bacterium]|nr:hypothetical protein [Gemmatimonadaceae bacterium]